MSKALDFEKTEPYRVLHIVPKMNRAGQETFIMNVYRAIDRDKVQFDFLCLEPGVGDYDEEILRLGGRIYHAPSKHEGIFKSYRAIKQCIQDGAWQTVHRHYGNATMWHELWAAKRAGAKQLIAHSHNTNSDRAFLHKLYRLPLYHLADWHLACSEAAGQWMYGNRSFQVISNAVATEHFCFDAELRGKKREELGLSEARVYLSVARLTRVKNQSFMLRAFKFIHEEDSHAHLLLVGQGEDESKLRTLCTELGLDDVVHFLGVRSDVSALLQAADLFCMPSLYEGLPVSLVEAQAAALPCLVSDRVSAEVKVIPELHFLSLEEGEHVWAQEAQKLAKSQRRDTTEEIRRAGYDIHELARRLEQIYTGL